jgi:hypothetical protein
VKTNSITTAEDAESAEKWILKILILDLLCDLGGKFVRETA